MKLLLKVISKGIPTKKYIKKMQRSKSQQILTLDSG